MSPMPFPSPTITRASAWERELLRLLVLADKLGVHLRLSVLLEYDVRDLQRLQWTLNAAPERPGRWLGRPQSPDRDLFVRAAGAGSKPA